MRFHITADKIGQAYLLRVQNAILQPAFYSKVFVLIFHNEILNGTKELAELAHIAGRKEDAQHAGIVKPEIELLVIFGAYYKKPAEVLMQLFQRVSGLYQYAPGIAPAFGHEPVDKIGFMLEQKNVWRYYSQRLLATAPVQRIVGWVQLFSLFDLIAHTGRIKKYICDLAEHAVLQIRKSCLKIIKEN